MREDENIFALTLLLEGAAGVVVSEEEAVVKVTVRAAERLLEASNASTAN
jgi:hypothetical protein